jgi:uncharacterized membrane protein
MKHDDFINHLDDTAILAAIAAAEKRCSGEIRVYVSHKERHDALAFARRRFAELGMAKTRQRNAVLIYLVPRTRQFAVVGDTGIHAKCGDGLWRDIVAGMEIEMKAGRFTQAITAAVARIGEALAKHFPADDAGGNELPDAIARD